MFLRDARAAQAFDGCCPSDADSPRRIGMISAVKTANYNGARRTLAACFVACSIAGCSSPGRVDDASALDATSDQSAVPSGDSAAGRDAQAPPADAATEPVFVFAHSGTALYQLDPRSRRLTRIGDFDCVTTMNAQSSSDGMMDLAIDRFGEMLGVGNSPRGHVLVRVQPDSGRCTIIGPLMLDGAPTQVQGLSFVPAGIVDPSNEALMGIGGDADYLRVDRTTAVVTRVGRVGDGMVDTRGGDFVSVARGSTYLIDSAGTIFTFDASNGRLLSQVAPRGVVSNGWGMGFWGGTVFNFTFDGQLIAIDPVTGMGVDVPIENPPAGLSFRGAAVTTIAPIVPPG